MCAFSIDYIEAKLRNIVRASFLFVAGQGRYPVTDQNSLTEGLPYEGLARHANIDHPGDRAEKGGHITLIGTIEGISI